MADPQNPSPDSGPSPETTVGDIAHSIHPSVGAAADAAGVGDMALPDAVKGLISQGQKAVGQAPPAEPAPTAPAEIPAGEPPQGTDTLPAPPAPAPAPDRPSLLERGTAAATSQFATGTLAGLGLYGALKASDEGGNPYATTLKQIVDTEILKWDLMPEAEGFNEHAASILGGFLGSVPTPESLINEIPGTGAVLAKGGEYVAGKLMPYIGKTAAELTARTAQRGATTGAIFATADPFIQLGGMHNGMQDRYDFYNTAMAFPRGFAVGAGLHIILGEGAPALAWELRGAKQAALAEAERIDNQMRQEYERANPASTQQFYSTPGELNAGVARIVRTTPEDLAYFQRLGTETPYAGPPATPEAARAQAMIDEAVQFATRKVEPPAVERGETIKSSQSPESIFEKTTIGQQGVLPGTEKSARQAGAAREAGGGLKADVAQQAPGGMFGEPKGPELFDNMRPAEAPAPRPPKQPSHIIGDNNLLHSEPGTATREFGPTTLTITNRPETHAYDIHDMNVIPEARRQGAMTFTMKNLVHEADAKGVTLGMDPAAKIKEKGAPTKKEVKEFLQRFGFIENKGKFKTAATDMPFYRPAFGVMPTKGPRRITRDPGSISLLEYLARIGIKDDPDIRASFGGLNPNVPFVGNLFKEKGLSIDHAYQAAVDGGYIHDPERISGEPPSSQQLNEFKRLLALEGQKNPQYPVGSEGPKKTVDVEAERHAAESWYLGELEKNGMKTTAEDGTNMIPPAELERAVDLILKEHMRDPVEIWERVVMESRDIYEKSIQESGGHYEHEYTPGWDDPAGLSERTARRQATGGGLPTGELANERVGTPGGGGRIGESGSGLEAGATARPGGEPHASGDEAARSIQQRIIKEEAAKNNPDRVEVQREVDDKVMEALDDKDPTHAASRGLAQTLPGQRFRSKAGVASADPLTKEQIANIVPIRQQINNLIDGLEAMVKVGHLTPDGRLGEHNMRQIISRIKNYDDLEVIAHELGHHIDSVLFRTPLQSVIAQHEMEMRGLVLPGYNVDKTWKVEGVAEFTRSLITNRAYAEQKAPGFYKAFRNFMETHDDQTRKFLSALDATEAAYQKWIDAPSGAVTRNFVVSWEPAKIPVKGMKDTVRYWLNNSYTAALDQAHPMAQITRKLQAEIMGQTGIPHDLPAEKNPAVLIRYALHTYSSAALDVLEGIRGYLSGDVRTAGLKEILTEAMGRANILGKWDDAIAHDFSTYLVARRALFEFERFKQGLIPKAPTGSITRGDWATTLAEIERDNPQFIKAADKFDNFRSEIWNLRHDAGQITDEQYLAGQQIKHHVPFWRDFSEDSAIQAYSYRRMGLEQPGGPKRFQGSARPILDPIQSTLKEISDLRSWIAWNDTIKALDDLATQLATDQVRGRGQIVERIRNTQVVGQTVGVEQALDAMGKKYNIDPVMLQTFKDDLSGAMGSDDIINLFSHKPIEAGNEPIVFYWRGGQRIALMINDLEAGPQLMKLLAQNPAPQRDLIWGVMGRGAMVMRGGTVTALPFAIVNLIRDTLSATIYHPGFIPVWSSVRGLVHWARGDEVASLYEAVGGQMGGSLSQAMRDMRMTREFQGMADRGYNITRVNSWGDAFQLLQSAMGSIAKLVELGETSTRLGTFSLYYKRGIGENLDKYTAAFRAMHEAVDTLDFSRHGSRTANITQVIPFLNANMQGLDRVTRGMIAPYAKKIMGEPMTAQETSMLKRSAYSWAMLSAGMGASMILRAFYQDDPEYGEISDYLRAAHWMVKIPWMEGGKVYDVTGKLIDTPGSAKGVWLAIPKPFEVGVFLNLAERMYEHLAMKDPRAMENWVKAALQNLAPPNPFTDLPITKNIIELQTGQDLFTGRSIIPDRLKGLTPEERVEGPGHNFSKLVAHALNSAESSSPISSWFSGWSPLEIEHLITGFTSSWGRDAMAGYDMAVSDQQSSWADYPFFRRFFRDPTRGSVSSNAFWSMISQDAGTLTQANKTFQTYTAANTPQAAIDQKAYLEKLDLDQRAFVALNNVQGESGDDKKLHPLTNAADGIGVLSAMRRVLANNNVQTSDEGTPIRLSPSQRNQLDSNLSLLQMAWARNAMIAADFQNLGGKQRGYNGMQPIDTKDTYAIIKSISPEVYDELSTRLADKKVYNMNAVAKEWPKTRAELLRDGTEADLRSHTVEILGDYEMGGDKSRKLKIEKPAITGEQLRATQ